ncbi:ABC transporter ATP-binding protein [Ruminococcaceae bacterium OttesenSCG-928-L11]|nr:ABC transporter ATP-binding protein [Ruminococcaceae bacterium OttesenSCG-928-L11]
MQAAIQITDLTRDYKNRRAVDHLNLTITKGEFFALLGTNGAGKTTTIKMLSCLLLPTEGDAVLLGNSIVHDAEKVKKIINVSPQETAIAPKLTVRENLELIARLYGCSKQEAQERAIKMLSEFDLTDRAKDKAKSLSGGMQRKLNIALGLISSPKILFLDEPTLGLDVRARKELGKTIETLKGKINIIVTTHYLEEAEALADRIGIMHEGKLQALGTAEEIVAASGQKNFEDAFLLYTGGV